MNGEQTNTSEVRPTDQRFPDDSQFEEHKLTEAHKNESGWDLRFDGFGFWCPPESPVEPKAGMIVRLYGKGFGSRVRGLFLDGQKVFYRNEREDKEHSEIELYGADATEWLKRWDAGRTVWTIEMGGLGPGYEQCIHITCAEILREMLTGGYDTSKWVVAYDGGAQWRKDCDVIDKKVTALPVIKELGLSGAQWGAAMGLAGHLCRHGPRKLMNDPEVKDRHIQVSKSFPGAA